MFAVRAVCLLIVVLSLPMPGQGVPPINDTCQSAIVVQQTQEYSFDSTEADNSDPCRPGVRTVWYRFTAPTEGLLLVGLCDSSFDTFLTVFVAEDCAGVNSQTVFARNDNMCGKQSWLSFATTAGTTYFMAASGATATDHGEGLFYLSFTPGLSDVQAGESCETAGVIPSSGDYTFDTTGSTGSDPCHAGSPTVYYSFVSPRVGYLRAQLFGSSYDTFLTAYAAPTCELSCANIVAQNDNYSGWVLASGVDFRTDPGARYILAISGANASSFGIGRLTLYYSPDHIPGDSCWDAIELGDDASVTFDLTAMSSNNPCAPQHPTMWYRYTAPMDGRLNVDLCGSSFDTVLGVLRADTCDLTCENLIVENDDSCGSQSAVALEVEAGATYFIIVRGYQPTDVGEGELHLGIGPVPPGDRCLDAINVTVNQSQQFNTTGALANNPCQPGSPTLWYRYTATRTRLVLADVCDSSFDTTLTVFPGDSCPTDCVDVVVQNDDGCGKQSALSFQAHRGRTYLLAVSGTDSISHGSGILHLTVTPQAGDSCAGAGRITSNGVYTFDTTMASANDVCRTTSPTVWYRFTAPSAGVVVADLCNSSFDTWMIVYSGTTCPTVCGNFVMENDDLCGLQSGVMFETLAEATYYFSISGYNSESFGIGQLAFEFIPQVGHTCDEAGVLIGTTLTTFDTTGASGDDPCRPGIPTLWYRFTAPSDGIASAGLCSSSFDPYLTVFAGDSCPTSCAQVVVQNHDTCDPQPATSFEVTGGATYHVAISGITESDFGPGQLSFNYIPVILGDVSVDGLVNVADVTRLGQLVSIGEPVPLNRGDVDEDGVVDDLDVELLGDLIVNN